MTIVFFLMNTMSADDLETQGVRALGAMASNQLFQYNPIQHKKSWFFVYSLGLPINNYINSFLSTATGFKMNAHAWSNNIYPILWQNAI